MQNVYQDWQGSGILLVRHAFVGSQQDVEFTGCEREELPVLDAGPASALNCDD